MASIITGVVTPDDRFLFDPGLGYPNFELIPFDFEVETKIYTHSYMTYKFIKEGEYIVRCHKIRKCMDPLSIPGILDENWKKVHYFDLTPRELSYFDVAINKLYNDPEFKSSCPLYSNIMVSGFTECNLKPVILKNTSFLIENDMATLDEVKSKSAGEILKFVEDHYPGLKADVNSAMMSLKLF